MEIKELANWDNEYHMVRMRTGIKAKLLLSKVRALGDLPSFEGGSCGCVSAALNLRTIGVAQVRRHGGSDTPNKFFNKTVTQV